jgi:hypothetical protein
MAIGIDNSKPDSYELEILTLVNNEGEGFDIRDLMIECVITESIRQNFLMGHLVIADSINLLENAKLFGQESLRLRFKQPAGINDEVEDDDLIDQIFRIYKIDNVSRLEETIQVYRLHITANEFIESRRNRISQAFRGSMTDIAAQIAEDNLDIVNSPLNKKLESYFEVREKSQGEQYHVIIPNWTVNYTINWLCSQAQGVDESSGLQDSFYWYQTANGGYRIQSLASMMKIRYAGGRPFTYSQAAAGENVKNVSVDSSDEIIGISRRILAYDISSHANILEATVKGLFGSTQTTIDNTYQFFTERSYSFLEKFYGGQSQAIENHPFVRVEPETIHIGESAGESEEVNISGSKEGKSISSYHKSTQLLLSDSSFVNDENNDIHQANHQTHLGSQQFRMASNELLNYHTVDLVLSARTDISVGQLINLDIPSVRPGEDEIEPKFYNGDHLITNCQWVLTQDGCTLNVKCIKDSVINNIETTSIEYGESI